MSRINCTLSEIWASTPPRLVISDASGVLYTDDNDIQHKYSQSIAKTVRGIRSTSPFWLGTNNTTESPDQISRRVHAYDIDIPSDAIFSSGLGLLHPEYRAMIYDKHIYTLGYSGSGWYAERAGGIASTLDQCDTIVLAASIGQNTPAAMDAIYDNVSRHPKPVICVNPDFYVHTQVGRYPVMGYYAAQLEQRGIPIHWVGKPFSNFSDIIRSGLESAGISPGPDIWFFDDNPKNVHQLTGDLGLSGALVMDTGLCFGLSLDAIQDEFGVIPPIRISALSFEEFTS